MTETTIKSPRDAAGKVLYLEFRKSEYTYQLIITEPIINLDGRPSRARVLSRRMNSWQSRKNWRFMSFGRPVVVETNGGATQITDLNLAKDVASAHLTNLMPTLNQLFHQEFSLYKKPLMVEISYEEFNQIRANKTPSGLIRRIQRTRLAQGFSEELVDTAPAASV